MISDKDVCFLQTFFCLCCESIMLNLKEGHPRIKVKEHNVNNLRYPDDAVLNAENKIDFLGLLDSLEEESSKKGWNWTTKRQK